MKKKQWLGSDSVALWTPGDKRFRKAPRRRKLKDRTVAGTGFGRRAVKMRVGE